MKRMKNYYSLIFGMAAIFLLCIFMCIPVLKYRVGNDYNSTIYYIRGVDVIFGGNIEANVIQKITDNVEGKPKYEIIKTNMFLKENFNIWTFIIFLSWFIFGISQIFHSFLYTKKKSFFNEIFSIILIGSSIIILFLILNFKVDMIYILCLLAIVYIFSSYIKEEGDMYFTLMLTSVSIAGFFISALFNNVNEESSYVLTNEFLILNFIFLIVNLAFLTLLMREKKIK